MDPRFRERFVRESRAGLGAVWVAGGTGDVVIPLRP
jgi:hypothetical protein